MRRRPKPVPPETRFWPKVDKRPDGCWVWTSAMTDNGYGLFRLDGKAQRAHRVAYGWLVGPIPEGKVLDHLCRVRACVNPDHLEPVLQIENMRRGFHATKTHCHRGHEFTPENTYRKPGKPNSRTCRACAALNMRRWWTENKEQYKEAYAERKRSASA